jgi:DNA-binding PadR family transcriptional regulator
MFDSSHAALPIKTCANGYAVLLGLRPCEIGPGRMSYELRRLRLHGLIERVPKTHRYRLTNLGLQTALFYTRVLAHLAPRPRIGLALKRLRPHQRADPSDQRQINRLDLERAMAAARNQKADILTGLPQFV